MKLDEVKQLSLIDIAIYAIEYRLGELDLIGLNEKTGELVVYDDVKTDLVGKLLLETFVNIVKKVDEENIYRKYKTNNEYFEELKRVKVDRKESFVLGLFGVKLLAWFQEKVDNKIIDFDYSAIKNIDKQYSMSVGKKANENTEKYLNKVLKIAFKIKGV